MISGETVVARAIAILPPDAVKTTYTLGSRQLRETGSTSVSWGYGRKFSTPRQQRGDQQLMMLHGGALKDQWHEFELFKTTETVTPQVGDTLTDDEGTVWQIKRVHEKMLGYAFDLLCLRNK